MTQPRGPGAPGPGREKRERALVMQRPLDFSLFTGTGGVGMSYFIGKETEAQGSLPVRIQVTEKPTQSRLNDKVIHLTKPPKFYIWQIRARSSRDVTGHQGTRALSLFVGSFLDTLAHPFLTVPK